MPVDGGAIVLPGVGSALTGAIGRLYANPVLPLNPATIEPYARAGLRGFRVRTDVGGGSEQFFDYLYDVGESSPTQAFTTARFSSGWTRPQGVFGNPYAPISWYLDCLDSLVACKRLVINTVFGGTPGPQVTYDTPLLFPQITVRIIYWLLTSPLYVGLDWEMMAYQDGSPAAQFEALPEVDRAISGVPMILADQQSSIAAELAKIANADTQVILNHGSVIYSVQSKEVTGA